MNVKEVMDLKPGTLVNFCCQEYKVRKNGHSVELINTITNAPIVAEFSLHAIVKGEFTIVRYSLVDVLNMSRANDNILVNINALFEDLKTEDPQLYEQYKKDVEGFISIRDALLVIAEHWQTDDSFQITLFEKVLEIRREKNEI